MPSFFVVYFVTFLLQVREGTDYFGCFVCREIFQCSVMICFWRVRHAWHKNLMKRCSDMGMCAEMLKILGQAVNKICKGTDTDDAFKGFMEDSVDAEEFMDYFKATWYPKIGNYFTIKR